MAQTPSSASQVSGERMRTDGTEAASIMSALRSSISSLRLTSTSSVPGFSTSSAATRPRMRSASDDTTSPSFTAASAVMALSVPQSRERTMQSCATSTRRRVRYPSSRS
jgi:hypothetical protein